MSAHEYTINGKPVRFEFELSASNRSPLGWREYNALLSRQERDRHTPDITNSGLWFEPAARAAGFTEEDFPPSKSCAWFTANVWQNTTIHNNRGDSVVSFHASVLHLTSDFQMSGTETVRITLCKPDYRYRAVPASENPDVIADLIISKPSGDIEPVVAQVKAPEDLGIVQGMSALEACRKLQPIIESLKIAVAAQPSLSPAPDEPE